ncbi:MAG: TlpA family protein disulfide reductase [Gammaproteobacteria bacterium]|nr:TlpA family protein disulfide reductase [Gammaproteobacteria bacterium]
MTYRTWLYRLIFVACLGGLLSTSASADDLPKLSLQTPQGGLRLNELRGQVVYVDFWASWCVPCRKSFPWMNQIHNRYNKDGLKIVAINLDKDTNLARKFLADYPANFTVAFDPDGLSAQHFKVQGMPSSYLIDRQGKIHARHIGFKEADDSVYETEIKQLLATP